MRLPTISNCADWTESNQRSRRCLSSALRVCSLSGFAPSVTGVFDGGAGAAARLDCTGAFWAETGIRSNVNKSNANPRMAYSIIDVEKIAHVTFCLDISHLFPGLLSKKSEHSKCQHPYKSKCVHFHHAHYLP